MTSNTCSFDVIPPGIMTRAVFAFLISPLTSWMCPLKTFRTRIPHLLRRKPGFQFWTILIQLIESSLVIQHCADRSDLPEVSSWASFFAAR
jgi:hypothetical protein